MSRQREVSTIADDITQERDAGLSRSRTRTVNRVLSMAQG